MAAVEVTIAGILYDKLDRTSRPVTLIGEASRTGLGVGGGPIMPGDPPGIWGPTDPRPGWGLPDPPPGIWGPNDPRPGWGLPDAPVALPPTVPSHPIVLPDDPPELIIWPPLPNNDLPDPPKWDPCRRLVYSLRYGWAVVQLPLKK